jgi:hypothetical protein
VALGAEAPRCRQPHRARRRGVATRHQLARSGNVEVVPAPIEIAVQRAGTIGP